MYLRTDEEHEAAKKPSTPGKASKMKAIYLCMMLAFAGTLFSLSGRLAAAGRSGERGR
jgi:hypothetical protein